MRDADAPDYYTIDEAARILNVSTDTIRRRIKEGKLRAEKRTFDNHHGHKERWCIPPDALGTREIVDVVPVKRDITVPVLMDALEAAISKRDEQIIERFTELFDQQATRLEQQNTLIEQLTADVAALKDEREQERGFWSRVFGRSK